jgi:hypothetical protein
MEDLRLDRLCGLAVNSGYRSRDPGFDYQLCQIFSEVVRIVEEPPV